MSISRSYISQLLPFSGIETLHYKDGTNSNIISIVNKKLQTAVDMTKDVAYLFKGYNDRQTVQNVFDFLLTQITYKADGSSQRVKLPNALVNLGVGDCKSYTLFAAAILINLGMDVVIRYAGYSASKPISHVYPIANGIICDAVYKVFDKEVPFRNKKDFIIKTDHD